jgi:hypothetical protein
MQKHSFIVCSGDCIDQARKAFERASVAALPESREMADLEKRFSLLRDVDATDRHKDAEITLEHALALYEAAFGQEHPAVAHIMLALAEVYTAHDKREHAEYMRKWASEILSRPKDEPTHEFFHLFGMDVPDDQIKDVGH